MEKNSEIVVLGAGSHGELPLHKLFSVGAGLCASPSVLRHVIRIDGYIFMG